MKNVLNFYIDDSGTRHPTEDRGTKPKHGYDWFAFGGILINEEDEKQARVLHKGFCEKWSIEHPLHSSEIRSQNENFFWLRDLSKNDRDKFYEELYCLMRDAPVIGLACVIDRPGYNNRYLEIFKNEPWSLCKTAFNVVVERASKLAIKENRKLRIFPERCNKPEDAMIRSYYDELKKQGLPFSDSNSNKYAPLAKEDFQDVLYDFKTKYKTSPLAQLADLYVWPICMGGYHASNRPYKRLREDGKLIECYIDEDEWSMLASKYSCFENVVVKL